MAKRTEDVPKPLTKKTWVKKYREELDGEEAQLYGYAEAVIRHVPVLEKMVNTAKDFEELKAQILKFTKQQMNVVNEIEATIQDLDAPYYGLTHVHGFRFK
jgi:hypothetical protein